MVNAPLRAAWLARIKGGLTPYHLLLAGAIGVATALITVIIAVLLLISTNFNLLAAIE